MARKYNLDKVYNYIMTETTLSGEECSDLLDVVEEQFSQNIQAQRKDELAQQSKASKRFSDIAKANRNIKDK